MKFYLNDKEINVLNGATFSLKKDETLDSGKIELIFSDSDTPILPMSLIRIEDNGETYNFLVILDIVEVATKKPKTYLHTITFAQNTKKFSKIQVRNTQFSQPAKNSLKCGCNATFINGSSTQMIDFVDDGTNGYSYSIEISNKHKVKNAYLQINTYYCKYTSDGEHSSNYTYYNNSLQDSCPSLNISFDIYKDGELYSSQSGAYKNGDITYLFNKLESGIYTIKNIKVLSLGSSYNANDLFIVNVALVCNVYYYSLYDILDILRKQIALQELSIEEISAPMIYLESEYNSTSKQYNIYARITNTNAQSVIATYWADGAITLDKTQTNISQYDSEKVLIGATKSGVVNVFAYLENTAKTKKSTTTSKSINFDASIVNPNLFFHEGTPVSGATSYNYEIANPNTFAVNCYVRYWQFSENSKPSEFTNVGILESNGSYTSKDFVMTKLYVECYFTKVNEEEIESGKENGYKFIPPVSYDYDLYLSDLGKDGAYSLKDSQQFQSDIDFSGAIQGWHYVEDNNLYDIKDYTMNSATTTYDGKHFNLYGYKTITIFAPTITTRISYNASSSGYDIYVKFTNINGVTCKVYYYAEGSITKLTTLVGELTTNETSDEILLGTRTTTSSGKITAYCVYETITSGKGEKTWSMGSSTVAPLVELNQDADLYTYVAVIKDLNSPRADLYYRYKFEGDWSNWIATANAQVQLTFANYKADAQTLYVEAYSSYEGIKSTTTSESVTIDGRPIAAPTINVSQYGSYSKQISITTNATQSDAKTYYKIWKNGVMPSTWSEYGGSFVLSASAGTTDSYTIYAKTTSTSASGSSEEVSVSFTIQGETPTYTLTVKHYKNGVFYTSDTYPITSGNTVIVSAYKKTISGYKYDHMYPGSNFTMTGDASIEIYYVTITHDYRFSGDVTWSDWEEVVEIDQGTTTTYYYYLKNSSTSNYSSSATYEKYDRNTYVEDITLSCSVNSSTGAVSGNTSHNNAESLVVDYGS
jgi:hypothetical protein